MRSDRRRDRLDKVEPVTGPAEEINGSDCQDKV